MFQLKNIKHRTKNYIKIKPNFIKNSKRNEFNNNLPSGLYLSIKEFIAQLGPKNFIADLTWLLQSITSIPPLFINCNKIENPILAKLLNYHK